MASSPKRFGFPVDVRLRRPDEYKRTLTSGKRVHCELLMAVVTPNPTNSPRLGLAIAKRQVRLAHERNRVKRIARDYFRRHLAEWPSFDCVVMAKAGIENVSNPELQIMMKQLFDKVAARCVGS
ncbi:MAG: ribonuclease P protein component [Halothiobacillus sp.]|nr:ribonuclease P protein component [Halothiobacillus sp.]